MHKWFKKWDVPGLHQNSVTSSAPPNNNISQEPTLVALSLPYERKKIYQPLSHFIYHSNEQYNF